MALKFRKDATTARLGRGGSSMYAVFETGGKQYKAAKGDIIWVEKLPVEPGKSVTFEALVVSDGDKVQIGTPTVKGVKVKAKVVEHGKEKKVVVYKYKSKDNYRKKQGHRQPYTKLEITGIATGKAATNVEEAMEAKAEAAEESVEMKPKAVPKAKATETKTASKAKAEPKAKATETKAKAEPKAKATETKAKAEPKAKATETKTAPKAKAAAKDEK